MDAGHRSKRLYPSYTTSELESWVVEGRFEGDKLTALQAEIAARKSGTSKHFVVPQIEGGKPVNKIGRM